MPHRTLLLLLAAWSGPADATSLRQGAESFARSPVSIDERMAQAPCAGGYRYRWADATGQAVEARCDVTGRRLVLPVAGEVRSEGRAGLPALRRGEAVQAEARGQGFRLRVDAVAAASAGPDGAVSLKNSRTGQRFAGRLVEDGRILVQQAGELD